MSLIYLSFQTGTLIILSDQFLLVQQKETQSVAVTHLKSTNEIRRYKACVYYFFANKDGRQLE